MKSIHKIVLALLLIGSPSAGYTANPIAMVAIGGSAAYHWRALNAEQRVAALREELAKSEKANPALRDSLASEEQKLRNLYIAAHGLPGAIELATGADAPVERLWRIINAGLLARAYTTEKLSGKLIWLRKILLILSALLRFLATRSLSCDGKARMWVRGAMSTNSLFTLIDALIGVGVRGTSKMTKAALLSVLQQTLYAQYRINNVDNRAQVAISGLQDPRHNAPANQSTTVAQNTECSGPGCATIINQNQAPQQFARTFCGQRFICRLCTADALDGTNSGILEDSIRRAPNDLGELPGEGENTIWGWLAGAAEDRKAVNTQVRAEWCRRYLPLTKMAIHGADPNW